MREGKIRTFLALELPETALEDLSRRQADLKKKAAGAGKLRWTRQEQFHLTLRFFGDTTPEERRAINQTVETVLAYFALSLPVQGRGLGVFPHWGRPRVLWAGLEPENSGLPTLFQQLNDGFAAAGLGSNDQHRFVPHITLCRIKSVRAERLRQNIDDFLSQNWTAPFRLRHLTLFASELSPRGARYSPLQRWELP